MIASCFQSYARTHPFRRSSLRLSCGNMSPHKIKDYSIVNMDIDVHIYYIFGIPLIDVLHLMKWIRY
ncbi:hypothetical protein Gogos_006125 [Gossypium gossypioides]|uniref:Uncharacterized protein n=1 Tax=Gossypium gossypioides TaxID=34282 RepID=A0A7J9C4P1_GOSGO|nr:hypothetical protein [Gossypium gossypioides]